MQPGANAPQRGFDLVKIMGDNDLYGLAVKPRGRAPFPCIVEQ